MLPQRNDAFRHTDLVENAIYVEGKEDSVTTYFNFRYVPKNLEDKLKSTLEIYSSTGQLLQTYTHAVMIPDVETHEFQWLTKDENGNFLPNGIYLFKFILESSEMTLYRSGKLILSQ